MAKATKAICPKCGAAWSFKSLKDTIAIRQKSRIVGVVARCVCGTALATISDDGSAETFAYSA